MSKKGFSTAPKPKPPTDEQIASFERGGAGHDRSKPVAKANPTEAAKRLSVDLPQSVHMRFKTACSATGRKMAGELLTLIEQRTQEMESEAGISHK